MWATLTVNVEGSEVENDASVTARGTTWRSPPHPGGLYICSGHFPIVVEALKPSQHPSRHIHKSAEKLMKVNVATREGTLYTRV